MAGRGDRDAEDLVGRYLVEIGRYPLLTADDEVRLANAMEAGRVAEEALAALTGRGAAAPQADQLRRLVAAGDDAKRLFIQSNLRLVVSIAKRHQRSGLPLLDLVQEGSLGLIRAVEKFDAGRGCKFSTYATWWIRQAITRAVADKGRTIRVPLHVLDTVREVNRSTDRLNEALGRRPTLEELARDVDLPTSTVLDAQRLIPDPVSLQSPVGRGEDEGELADLIEDPDAEVPFERAMATLRSDAVHAALDTLSEREQRVLSMRFGLAGGAPRTLEQVGQDFRLTRERIRQIEAKALARLRHPASPPNLRRHLLERGEAAEAPAGSGTVLAVPDRHRGAQAVS